MSSVTQAVIPAAGMGTRFLPLTKSVPKEMLPIVDTPVIQFVIAEALASGITEIHIITSESKRVLKDHFDPDPQLESFLRDAGKDAMIDQLHAISGDATINYIYQKQQRGLGDAVRCARSAVGDEPFAVLLGDTIIDPLPGVPAGLKQLIDVYEQKQGSVVSARCIPREWVSRYGILDGQPIDDRDDLLRLARLVEKPRMKDAPTNLAIAGRYVFSPRIFEFLEDAQAGVGGEIQLTDAMNALAQVEPFFALAWQATRFDIGNRTDYVRCFVELALRREDIGDDVRKVLNELLAERKDDQDITKEV